MRPPDLIDVWVCDSCGHWTANSYFKRERNNPDWAPRCKTKDGCERPVMRHCVYRLSLAETDDHLVARSAA